MPTRLRPPGVAIVFPSRGSLFHMKMLMSLAAAYLLALPLTAAERFADRFVWIFGWDLDKDSDVDEISRVVETANKHRFNGAVMSLGLDSLCKKSPEYFRRLNQIKQRCEDSRLELIPSVFSVGYGGGALAHDRNLAEGLSVENAPFVVQGNEARLAATNSVPFQNGGFEESSGNKLKSFDFQDQPGEISFVDAEIKHGGITSLRLQNFTADANGHGRVMQSVRVQPHRCYRLAIWVKTEGLQPTSAFRLLALAHDRDLAPREFHIASTSAWRKITMLFNSLSFDKVSLYAGLWDGKAGKVWLDDWSIEEVGPVNVLRRQGTPVSVRSEDGSVTYTEGKDYEPLRDPTLQLWQDEKEALPLRLVAGSRIRQGERLRVSWYHSMIINDSQVGVCMAEPALYEIFDHEAKLLAEKLQPRSVLLNMDEIRMAGTCKVCQGRNMAELLGECITKQASILRAHNESA